MASSMKYVKLGNSGLKVSKLILGCMSYGSAEWQSWVLGEEEGLKHIKAAYDAGINTFDTANVYSNGLSEVVLGKAIKQYNLPRDEIVVMTKLYFVVGREPNVVLFNSTDNPDNAGYCNQHGLSRKHIFDSVKHSLERLQLDYTDVLQCHRFDYDTPSKKRFEFIMQALHDVVKAGYVRYIGMSSCFAYQFSAMQNYAIQNKLTPFISMQNHYSLVYREEEREIMIKSYANDASTSIVNRVEELAKKKGASMAQIALAWCMAKDGMSNVKPQRLKINILAGVTAPIVGTTSLENLHDLLGAVNIELTADEMKYLEEPYQPRNIIGHS
ncbi:aryl-alcohol dehydrogenase [Mycena galopus ATCC 62051]|nr:aryl-alcohol dehydrogenase [Mycena galopus ATCC 62051]